MNLASFLVQAKLAGYATSGEGGERDTEDCGKEFHFEAGELKYRDRYYGFNPFAGEELVWSAGRPIWLMNYYGLVTGGEVEPAEVFEFLKAAMQRIDIERPYRGPSVHEESDYEYRDESWGSIQRFRGKEVIRYRGEDIYELSYQGGMLAEWMNKVDETAA